MLLPPGPVAFHLPHQLIHGLHTVANGRQLFAQALNSVVDGFVPSHDYRLTALRQEALWRRTVSEQAFEEQACLVLACSLNPITMASKALTDAQAFRDTANLFFNNKALAVKIQVDLTGPAMAISRQANPCNPALQDPCLCQEATTCILDVMRRQIGPRQSQVPPALKTLARELGQEHTPAYALISLLQERPSLHLAQAAMQLGCSARTLQRQLHSDGLSFPRLRLAGSLLLSVRLLAQGDTLSHTAADTGFHDYPHFARIFKRSTGMSPQAYKGILRRTDTATLIGMV